MTAADQVVDLGRLPGGAVVTVHNRGALSRATNFRREINGAEGDLVVSAPVGHPQPSPLTLEGGRGTSTAQASSGSAVSRRRHGGGTGAFARGARASFDSAISVAGIRFGERQVRPLISMSEI
ncbi:hypothetical protein ACFY2D_34295 [Streptomyces nigra]|uniref:hypothetical protein n=1 Tax=Streptomyces nigra TaxID=1827580 RepID=UPI003683B5AC